MQRKNTLGVRTLLKEERGGLSVGIILALFCSALSFVPYFVIYQMILSLIQQTISFSNALFWAIAVVVAAALQNILLSCATICTHTAAFNTMHRLKLRVLEHLSRLNLGFFHDHAPGRLKGALFDDIGRLEDFIAHHTMELAQAVVAPLQDIDPESLMDLTAFVFQDIFLMEDTLFETIRMGSDAAEEQVITAAKAAQIDDFIRALPQGYQTRMGDKGAKLYGGQRRIVIARAILKDAPIVIFDEAPSYSDIENEHEIQLALQSLLRGKTTILVAHHLHTIRNADRTAQKERTLLFHDPGPGKGKSLDRERRVRR